MPLGTAVRAQVARRYGATGPGVWPVCCVYCCREGSIIWREPQRERGPQVRSITLDGLTFDHWTPRAHGGTDDAENLVLACQDCNRQKADLAPEKAVDAMARGTEGPLTWTCRGSSATRVWHRRQS